jgi:hypothetical protein
MSKLVVVLAAIFIAASALSASAAMTHPTTHKPAKHITRCTSEFMYMDPKSHKCTDARVTL